MTVCHMVKRKWIILRKELLFGSKKDVTLTISTMCINKPLPHLKVVKDTDHLIHGSTKLFLYVSFLFKIMIAHGYISYRVLNLKDCTHPKIRE